MKLHWESEKANVRLVFLVMSPKDDPAIHLNILAKIAGIASAYIAPTYIPASIIKPADGSIPNVKGTNKARPIVAVSPGIAPNNIPRAVPAKISNIFSGKKE